MFRPNFYADIDTINAILDLKFDESIEADFKDLEISLEVVEIPYYFIYSSDEENQNLKVFSRGELHRVVDDGIQCGDAEKNKETGEGTAHVVPEIGNNAFAIMECCHKISQFIQINDMAEKCMELNPDESGIMFYVEDGELKYKNVSGQERPNLMFARLFCEPEMGRPYMDEVSAAWEREELSVDEKRASAEAGDAIAQADLANTYMIMGNSTNLADSKADYKEAVKWAKKSVNQNCANGMWVLALAYEHGRGVRKNMAKAIELYRQGAELGHSGCMNNLGQAYMEGKYIEKNKREAFRLFKASADRGYGIAMYNVGRCYQFAWGTKGNMKTAVEWYEKALEIIDDPELERKVATYRTMVDIDLEFSKDYDEADDE